MIVVISISYFPMGFPDHEKPRSMSFSLCWNLYASISFPLKHNPYYSTNKLRTLLKKKKKKKEKKKKTLTRKKSMEVQPFNFWS